MAQNLYVRDDVRRNLETLSEAEHRALIDELEFLICHRMAELGLAPVTKASLELEKETA